MMGLRKIFIHFVWRTHNNFPYINPELENILFDIIIRIIEENQCECIAINGTEDHVHLLVGLDVNITISKLIKDIKGKTSYEMKNKNFDLYWEKGYAANSIGRIEFEQIKNYINNQKHHHKNKELVKLWEI